MRYRRRRLFRRRPIRRYGTHTFRSRRVRYNRFRLRRRKPSGNFSCQLRRTFTISVPNVGGYTVVVAPTLADFPESTTLSPNFEAYRMKSVRVKVIPQQNVGAHGATLDSKNAVLGYQDSTMYPYYSAPYHTNVTPSAVTSSNILSIDKSRQYSGFAQSTRIFKPAVMSILAADNKGGSYSYTKTNWSPRIELNQQGGTSDPTLLNHYCALYLFVGPPSSGPTVNYDITYTANVTFYNQKVAALH